MANFYTFENNILNINILWNPWSKRDWFWKVVWDKLKLSVKKAPENGEATEYMRKFIAASFWVSLKNVSILFWETSQNKAFSIKNPLVIPESLKNIIKINL